MDNFNSWHDQRMVESKVKEIQAGAGDGGLRRAERSSHSNWLVRTAGALFKALIGQRKASQGQRSREHVSYRSCAGKVTK